MARSAALEKRRVMVGSRGARSGGWEGGCGRAVGAGAGAGLGSGVGFKGRPAKARGADSLLSSDSKVV